MAGTLARFRYRSLLHPLAEIAHHEAAHALRAHSYGAEVKAISLSEFRGGFSRVRLGGNAAEHSLDVHTQISLVGPVASLRYLRENPDLVIFADHSLSFGECETDIDLVQAILGIQWICQGKWVRFGDLWPEIFADCKLAPYAADITDFENVFDILILRHFNRYFRIPRISTLLRHYREQERIAQDWIATNWPTICALASHILKHEKRTTQYTHMLPGKNFYSWVRRIERTDREITPHANAPI